MTTMSNHPWAAGAPATRDRPELPLPTAADVAAAWGLGYPLAQAVEMIADAAPIATDRIAATHQARRLKRAFGLLLRASVEARVGLLPASKIMPGTVPHATAIGVDDAATALGLTFGLANALRAIHCAATARTADEARAQLDEAMAALHSAITVREAVAWS
jgi:hypothetical protein